MKILKSPAPISIQVELTYDELCGILKMVGSTSTAFRMREYKLTKEQSDAVEEMYNILSEHLPEYDR